MTGIATVAEIETVSKLIEKVAAVANTDRILRIPDVARILGRSDSAAWGLIVKLEALGLKRKGGRSGSHWLASQFWAAYRRLDETP